MNYKSEHTTSKLAFSPPSFFQTTLDCQEGGDGIQRCLDEPRRETGNRCQMEHEDTMENDAKIKPTATIHNV